MLEEPIQGHVAVRPVVPLRTDVEVVRQIGQQAWIVARRGEGIDTPAERRVGYEFAVGRRNFRAREVGPHLQFRRYQEIQIQRRQEITVRVVDCRPGLRPRGEYIGRRVAGPFPGDVRERRRDTRDRLLRLLVTQAQIDDQLYVVELKVLLRRDEW